MAITYESFTILTEFSSLTEPDYLAFKTLVDAELMLRDWGILYDSAFIALMGHKLTLRNEASERSPDTVKQFERNDEGYTVTYADKDLGSTKYGIEYQRLLSLLESQSPASTENRTQFHSASRPLKEPNPKRPIKF
jgi:hypothetical protein